MKVKFLPLLQYIEYHTYKSVKFLKNEIPEGIGPLNPLPCIVLSKLK